MRLFILIILPILAGCFGKQKEKQVRDNPGVKIFVANSLPIQLDSSFNDFIFKFGSNEKFQKGRIKFPLEYDKLGVKSYVQMRSWKHDYLFVTLESITDISNGIKNDENSNERVFTWINTKTGICRNYFFENNGIWMLTKISETNEFKDTKQENFISFLSEFCRDSIFQKQRTNFPLEIIHLNDDFEEVKENIAINKWQYSSIYYSCDSVAIQYYDFKKNFKDTNLRILMIHGVENGIDEQLTFRRINGIWILTKFEDYST